MKKAISKINPFRYAKKLHIGYIWLIAVLLLLVVGVICSGAKVYKYSPILSVVSYSLAAISLIAIIIMIVRKTSDMKIQSELDKYILVLNEHKDDQEWLHKELTYVNLRIYNKTNGHLYRCKKKLLEEYKNEANNESVAEELMVRLKEQENRHQQQIEKIEELLVNDQKPLQYYLDAIENNGNDNPADDRYTRLCKLFSFIYNYISTELDDCLKPYEVEYFKKYAFAQITGMPIEEDIQYPISEIYRMSKTDLGAFIHNLYIMCHYCRTDLKKTDFFNGCQKFISASFCTANGLPISEQGTILFRKNVKLSVTDIFEDDDIDVLDESQEEPPIYTDSLAFNSQDTTDIHFEYTLDCQIINRIFGKGNYRVIPRFFYKYKENRNWATTEELDRFNDQIHTELKGKVGIEKNGSSIGIDFKWKENSLPEILTQLSREYGFIDFSLFKKGHKCNFDIKYKKAELTNIMEELHDSFDKLNVELVKKGTELSFFREFDNLEELIAFRPQLQNKLNSFDANRYKCIINDIPAGYVKLLYYYDKKSHDEERVDAIRELKGADFSIGDLPIGKLIRISNYPEIVIDISGDNYEVTKQLIEETQVSSITPDLSGDLEKLARLKESLNRIVQGRDVENVSLGDFIFDASKAGGIKDFEESIRLEEQEISKHILNGKIDKNQPQKTAIAKALLAPDLALIQGPPGTGKSTAIAELIWQHTRKYPDKRILLTSETNLAVDNAIDRVVNPYHNLIKPIRIGDESRLETEGLQFSYSAMYRWAKGEDWNAKKKNASINDDDDDEENDVYTDMDSIYEAPEKLILLNWMENIGRRLDSDKMPSVAQELWKDLLENPTSELKNLFFDNYIKNCNVIGATCSSIGQKNIIMSESIENTGKRNSFVPTKFYRIYRQIFADKEGVYNPKIYFDMVIQDESSKATPAELSLPLIYGKKNVIIGDHRQLPPMLSRESFINSFDYLIKREKNDDERQKMKELRSYVLKNFKTLEISHFERLFTQIDDNLKGVFNYQFRMHPAINDVIKQFYKDEGGLECGLTTPIDLGVDDPDYINNGASRYHGITAGPINPETHVLWIDSSSPEMLDGTSRVNYGEVAIIKKLLTDFNESESFHNYVDSWDSVEDKQIGLISFYGKQLRLLKDMTREFDSSQIPVRVSTVDRFQGMERNIIIVSMVRSHCIQNGKNQKPNFERYPVDGFPKQEDLGFAQSPNRLNVALSRAKRLLIIVGDSKLFRTKDIYENVYQTIADPNNKYGKIITASEYGL